MGKCLFMRKGETHTAPVKTFADTSWADIINACQTDNIPNAWNVGDQKAMNIDGKDYLIDIIGKNHDTYSDGSGKAPLTFQLHDCYDIKYDMNGAAVNNGGWNDCKMRSTNLPAIMALMPTEVVTCIKEVNKLASEGGNSSTINTTKDKLFLLSEIEIFGTATYSVSGEGSQYAYYAAGNSKVKTYMGNSYAWFTRSTRKNNTTLFVNVDVNGGSGGSTADETRGVSFAFCF